MKKQIIKRFTTFLASTMILAMLPGSALTVSAAVSNKEVIAWNDTNNDGKINNGETTYNNLTIALNAGGTVKLTGGDKVRLNDCAEDRYINLKEGTVTLDLNGHELAADSFEHKGIVLSGSARLTITDSAGGGTVDTASMKDPIRLKDASQLTIAGGTVNAGYFALEGSSQLTITGGVLETIYTSAEHVAGFVGSNAGMRITGGATTFDPRNWLPDSYMAVPNKEVAPNYWEVLPVTETEAVVWMDTDGNGRIDSGERMFGDLEDALYVGGSLKLYRDLTVDQVIHVQSDAELDLNGHRLTATHLSQNGTTMLFNMSVGSISLTLRDSKGSGVIDCRERDMLISGDPVTIESGTYYVSNSKFLTSTYSSYLIGGTYNLDPYELYRKDGYTTEQTGDMWKIYPLGDNCTVSIEGNYYYTGSAILPTVTVTDPEGRTLQAGTDYTLSYANHTEAGTATVTATFIRDYRGTKTANFTIHSFTVSHNASGGIALPAAGQTVSLDLVALVDGREDVSDRTVWTLAEPYTGVAIRDGKAVIDAAAPVGTVKIRGAYDGTEALLSFTLSLNALPEVTISEDAVYNGADQKPVVAVAGLTEGADYTVTYRRGEAVTTDFINVGTITIAVEGKGTYDGMVEKHYTILNKTFTEEEVEVTEERTYSGTEQKPEIAIDGLAVTAEEGVHYTVTYQREGTDTANLVDTGAITVMVEGIGNCTGTITRTYTIVPAALEEAKVTLEETEVSWDGQAHTPVLTVRGLPDGAVLTEGRDYTIAYTRDGEPTEDLALCGTIEAVVSGMGNYTGTVTKSMTIDHTYDEQEICRGCAFGYYYVAYTWSEEQGELSSEVIHTSGYTPVTAQTTEWTTGWYMVEEDVTVSDLIQVNGDVSLILMDGMDLRASKGIRVTEGNSLTIYGQRGSTGKLTAVTNDHDQAGIGGTDTVPAGTIVIHGGEITAKVSTSQIDAIGNDYGISGGRVIIYHGTILADAASNNGSGGIGVSDTTIYGGDITALGGHHHPGIGSYNDDFSIAIHGGTIRANGGTGGAGIGGGYCTDLGTVVITGGNIKAVAGGRITGQSKNYPDAIGTGSLWKLSEDTVSVTDGRENSVSLQTLTLEGAADGTAVTAAPGLEGYRLRDVKTLDDNKLYFYLTEGAVASTVTAGEQEYCCKDSESLTYYTAHSWAEGVCGHCGLVCEHEWQEGVCGICEKQHGHVWTYTAAGSTITAACAEEGCPDTAGGSVTLHADGGTYNGSAFEAGITYSGDWKPEREELTVSYRKRSGQEWGSEDTQAPVEAGTYQAGITLGEASVSVVFTIDRAMVDDVPADAGSYEMVLALTDPVNYRWGDSDSAEKTILFTITKAEALQLEDSVSLTGNKAGSSREINLTALDSYPERPGSGSVNFTVASFTRNGLTGAEVSGNTLTLTADQADLRETDTVVLHITGMGNYADTTTLTLTVSYLEDDGEDSGDNGGDGDGDNTGDGDGDNTGDEIKEKPWIFTDVDPVPGEWKYDNIYYVYQRDLMADVGNSKQFRPNDTLTRAMFVTVLYRISKEPEIAYTPDFTDVPDGTWFTSSILWANRNKLAEGYSNKSFGANDPITREQIAKILYLYGAFCGYDVSGRTALDQFTDPKEVSDWAVDYIRWAVDAEMISGKPNGDGSYRIDPKGKATRAECAKMLTMFLKKYSTSQ